MPSPTQKEEDRFEKIVARLDDLTFDGEGNAQGSGHGAYVKATQALHAAGQKWQVVFQKAAQSATAPGGTELQAQLDAFISANAEMARANEELRRENQLLRTRETARNEELIKENASLRKKYDLGIKIARIGGLFKRRASASYPHNQPRSQPGSQLQPAEITLTRYNAACARLLQPRGVSPISAYGTLLMIAGTIGGGIMFKPTAVAFGGMLFASMLPVFVYGLIIDPGQREKAREIIENYERAHPRRRSRRHYFLGAVVDKFRF